MTEPSYRVPPPKGERRLSLGLGLAFAVALFIAMALAQMLGSIEPPDKELEELVTAYVPPDIEEIEEDEPPPPEEEEPPPELEEAPPQLSLDQLDIALNPGTGGSLMGDFAIPTINATSQSLGTEDFVDFSALDQLPRPLCEFNFPARLKRKQARGRIVVLIKLDEGGSVLDAQLDSSNLPDFEDYVVRRIQSCKFTQPTVQGEPVKAQARLPIPIHIN